MAITAEQLALIIEAVLLKLDAKHEQDGEGRERWTNQTFTSSTMRTRCSKPRIPKRDVRWQPNMHLVDAVAVEVPHT